jgi:excisionase family DNA binding protein
MASVSLMPVDETLALIRSTISDELAQFKSQIPQTKSDKLLSIEETAKLLRVSKVTIHKWKKKKLIQHYRIGRKIYFKEQELIGSLSLIPQKKIKKI